MSAPVEPSLTPRLVADEVRRRMADLGLTVSALATASGVPRTTLKRRLMGAGGGFNMNELYEVSKVLGVRVSTLVGAALARA